MTAYLRFRRLAAEYLAAAVEARYDIENA